MNAFNWQAPDAQRAGIKDSKAAPAAPPMPIFALSRKSQELARNHREQAITVFKKASAFNVAIANQASTDRTNSIGGTL